MRRLRIIVPFALALFLIVGTVVSWWWSEPDRSDEAYLSPAHSGEQGGGGLAKLLQDRGVQIKPQATASQALQAARVSSDAATLFMPAPRFLRPDQLASLERLPAGTRVVLVEPGRADLRAALPQLDLAGRRWATTAGPPGDCPLTDAGTAGVIRSRYTAFADSSMTTCYDGALVGLHRRDVEFVVVGSGDPFRDDRLSEFDNAQLAADLLGSRGTLLWLVAREVEPRPLHLPPPPVDRKPQQVEEDVSTPPSPFPPTVWAMIVLALIAGAAVALAAGRRLGKALPEPLPIKVSGAETALGRARLYHRADAREAALEVLRADARRRISAASRGSSADGDELARRSGLDAAQIADALHGPAPDDDADLMRRAWRLQQLVDRFGADRLTPPAARATEENERD